jgi:cell division protein FtsW
MRQDEQLRVQAQRNREPLPASDGADYLAPPRRINSGLFVIILIMICFGLVMLFSASMSESYASKDGNSMYFVIKQGGITAIGLIAALIVAMALPVRLFDHFWMAAALYAVTTGLLVYVKLFGDVINGARRWVTFGVSFQPSELAKLAMVFCFAGYVSMRRRQAAKPRRCKTRLGCFLADGWLDILIPAGALLAWIALIAWQPHVSCAIIMCFIMLVIFLCAGIPARSWGSGILQAVLILAILALLTAAVLPLLPQGELRAGLQDNFEHVAARLDTFLHPETATEDATYQIKQSIIAMGSGGLTGLGLGSGRQKYNYLPEAHNDYVFAIIGEELGFAGTLAVLLLFVLFMLIGTSITRKAAHAFPAILAGGYTMLISIQAFLNMAVATRTIPATGISLPFFSYGGTSNLFFLMAIGFILAVSRSGLHSPRSVLLQKAQPEAGGRAPADLGRQLPRQGLRP